jgi:hypothetical protein
MLARNGIVINTTINPFSVPAQKIMIRSPYKPIDTYPEAAGTNIEVSGFENKVGSFSPICWFVMNIGLQIGILVESRGTI